VSRELFFFVWLLKIIDYPLNANTQAYAAGLSFISIVSRGWSTPAIAGSVFTLRSALVSYVYRDLWPLAKYDGDPADIYEGNVYWVKIALLAASMLLMMSYTFLDPVNAIGHEVSFLRADRLRGKCEDEVNWVAMAEIKILGHWGCILGGMPMPSLKQNSELIQLIGIFFQQLL